MAQAISPYRDPRDAEIEILRAENEELRKRLSDDIYQSSEFIVPFESPPEYLEEKIKARRRIVEKKITERKTRRKMFKKIVTVVRRKCRSIHRALDKNEELVLFIMKEYDNYCWHLGADGVFYFGRDELRRHWYWNINGRTTWSNLIDFFVDLKVSPQELAETVEKNIAAFFAEKTT